MTIMHADDWLTVYQGDCRTILPTLAADSIDCVVTSPPFWGLRDYGTASWYGGDSDCTHEVRIASPDPKGRRGAQNRRAPAGERLDRQQCRCGALRLDSQMGLEATPDAYVDALVAVFREIWRVLRPTGTVWLNLGDSYAAKTRGSDVGWDKSRLSNPGRLQKAQSASLRHVGLGERHRGKSVGLKPKDLVGIPWRVAFALQADGWYLRMDIIWAKPNPMPESVTDRPTKSHEYLFLLAKSERYHYDQAAIREHGTTTDPAKLAFGPRPDIGLPRDTPDRRRAPKTPAGWDTAEGSHDGIPEGRYADNRWPRGWASGPDRGHDPRVGRYEPPESDEGRPIQPGRNRRSVWTIATQPYPGAHFATFPEALVEPCVLAGCPEGGTVLDPFAGTGTVGVVANRLTRRAVLIDLNATYIAQSLDRTVDRPFGLELEGAIS